MKKSIKRLFLISLHIWAGLLWYLLIGIILFTMCVLLWYIYDNWINEFIIIRCIIWFTVIMFCWLVFDRLDKYCKLKRKTM